MKLGKLALLFLVSSGLLAGPADAQGVGSVGGRTYRFWEPSHGAQIEYMGLNGRAYLWYPGNRPVVPSLWREQAIGGIASLCFLYPTRSYNPVTGQGGGNWECRPRSRWQRNVVEVARGDVFGLARSPRVPFPLPRQNLPFSELKRAAEGSGLRM